MATPMHGPAPAAPISAAPPAALLGVVRERLGPALEEALRAVGAIEAVPGPTAAPAVPARSSVGVPILCPDAGVWWILTLSASRESVVAIAASMTGLAPDEAAADRELLDSTLAELANVTGGMLKTALYDSGAPTQLRTPVPVAGPLTPPAAEASARAAQEAGVGVDACVVALVAEPVLVATPAARPGSTLARPAAAGETLLAAGERLTAAQLALLAAADVPAITVFREPLDGGA